MPQFLLNLVKTHLPIPRKDHSQRVFKAILGLLMHGWVETVLGLIKTMTEEFHSPRQMAHRRFVPVHLEFHTPLDESSDAVQSSQGRTFGAAEDNQIVGISRKAVPPGLQLLVQFVQVDVGQQR